MTTLQWKRDDSDLFSLSSCATSCHIPKNASYVIFPQGEGEIAIKREGVRLWCHRDERASRKVAPTAVLRTIGDIASYFIPQIPRVSSFKKCNDLSPSFSSSSYTPPPEFFVTFELYLFNRVDRNVTTDRTLT